MNPGIEIPGCAPTRLRRWFATPPQRCVVQRGRQPQDRRVPRCTQAPNGATWARHTARQPFQIGRPLRNLATATPVSDAQGRLCRSFRSKSDPSRSRRRQQSFSLCCLRFLLFKSNRSRPQRKLPPTPAGGTSRAPASGARRRRGCRSGWWRCSSGPTSLVPGGGRPRRPGDGWRSCAASCEG